MEFTFENLCTYRIHCAQFFSTHNMSYFIYASHWLKPLQYQLQYQTEEEKRTQKIDCMVVTGIGIEMHSYKLVASSKRRKEKKQRIRSIMHTDRVLAGIFFFSSLEINTKCSSAHFLCFTNTLARIVCNFVLPEKNQNENL